jgi:hypothetical protein
LRIAPQSGQCNSSVRTIVSREDALERAARAATEARASVAACVESSAGIAATAGVSALVCDALQVVRASCNCANVASSRSDDRPNCQRFSRAISPVTSRSRHRDGEQIFKRFDVVWQWRGRDRHASQYRI